VPGDPLKHDFLELTKGEFWAFQEAKITLSAIRPMQSSFYRIEKESRKRLQSIIRPAEKFLFRLNPNRLFGLVGRQKMKWQCLATT